MQNVLGNPDLLLAARVVRGARATVGTPGAHGELQAAVVAVTCVNRPVTAGLAGRDGIPVDPAVRIRGAGRQRQRCHSERSSRSERRSVPAETRRTESAPAPTSTAARGATYVVRSGDTLSKIAQQLDIAGGWKALYQKNQAFISNPNLILVGQKIATK